MKITKSFIVLIFSLIIGSATNAQLTFSASPGLQLYGGALGYKFNKAVPFIGLNTISGSVNILETGYDYNDNGDLDRYTNKYKIVGSAFVPTLGLKYFMKETDKVKTYVLLSATTVLFSAEIKESDDFEENQDLQNQIDNVRIFGGQLGFGAEYFFDPMFSVGGEFGLRMLFFKNEIKGTDNLYNPQTGEFESKPRVTEIKYNLNPTYARITLNFYFKGRDGEAE